MSQEKLIKWLEGEGKEMMVLQSAYSGEAYVRHRYNDDLDLILRFTTTENGCLELREAMKYQGIWNRTTKELYDWGYNLGDHLKEYLKPENSHSAIYEDIESSVRAMVEKMVEPDADRIKIENLAETEIETPKYYAQSTARQQYLSGQDSVNKYECGYEPNGVEGMILRYLTDRDGLIRSLSKQYITENGEKIHREIIQAKLAEQELSNLNRGSNIHLKTMREIIRSVPPDCRTVNVTTVIEGKEMTFKIEASTLKRDCGHTYSTWNILSQDRYKFEKLYGRSASFAPTDITRITYGKKTLYERTDDTL